MDRDQKRLELQAILQALIPNNKVYFQPPSTIKMQYPCIVFQRDTAKTDYASNKLYHNTLRYQVTVIDRNPDSLIPSKVESLPYSSFNRFYAADDLNHDVFNVYF